MTYPNDTPSNGSLHIQKNNFGSVLQASVSAADVSMTLSDTSLLPGTGLLTLESEAIEYTSNATGTGVISGMTRALSGTTAVPHDAGITVYANIQSAYHNRSKDEIIAIATDLRSTFNEAPDQSVSATDTASSIENRQDMIITVLKEIIDGVSWKSTPKSLSELGSNLFNIVDNGNMNVWQRGVTFSSPADGVFVADRWDMQVETTPSFTITRESTASNVDNGSFSLSMAVSNRSGSTRLAIRQAMERPEEYRNKTISLRGRLKTTITSGVKVKLDDGVSGTTSSAHTGGGAFETLDVSLDVNASSASINIQAGFTETNDMQTTGTVYIDSLMLVVGTQQVDIVPENGALEMARCQRFYEELPAVPEVHNLVSFAGGDFHYRYFKFKAEKSSSPTITVGAASVTLRDRPSAGTGSTNASGNFSVGSADISTDGFRYVHSIPHQTQFDVGDFTMEWEAEV